LRQLTSGPTVLAGLGPGASGRALRPSWGIGWTRGRGTSPQTRPAKGAPEGVLGYSLDYPQFALTSFERF
jgi:hypothetical protein